MLKPFWTSLAFMLASTLWGQDVYQKATLPSPQSDVDRLLESVWKKHALSPAREASDSVFVRRAYLDFLGRTPSLEEAKAYVESDSKEKRALLIEQLLTSPEFALYGTLRFGDALRIKSEFPINLWPNAVYPYTRRVHEFLAKNEPYDHFVRALLLSEGSNFRQSEVNFYRAMAIRSPEGIADAAASFLMGSPLTDLPETVQKTLPAFFECVTYKKTKEWKEEIVMAERLDSAREFTLPNGKVISVEKGGDPRKAFCQYLTEQENPYFAQALVQRVWGWFFGNSPKADDEVLAFLSAEFKQSSYDLQSLCRMIGNSSAYRLSSFYDGDIEKALACHAVYPLRRLGAEVLDDTIRAITRTPAKFSSVIPEPFTFIPADMRTIALADGSINDSFLLLFGRPPRDSGLPEERNNEISTKQRLFLYNSGDLFRRLSKMPIPSRDPKDRISNLYWIFYARPPTENELSTAMTTFGAKGKQNKQFYGDLAWILLNSKEFIHQH